MAPCRDAVDNGIDVQRAERVPRLVEQGHESRSNAPESDEQK
jgi:hypothetical protein